MTLTIYSIGAGVTLIFLILMTPMVMKRTNLYEEQMAVLNVVATILWFIFLPYIFYKVIQLYKEEKSSRNEQ